MGVPKFFRWVAERYPLVITPFQDSPPPVDNLYLDMNGIIHHCSHPNDVDASRKSLSEREMVEAMFAYLEKIFQAIQPKKYFFLAVDGCAPRAKMNQQRQRRFRSGFDMMVAREEALARGEEIPEEGDVFDSNCITPGTEFMHRVGEQFKYFLTMKIHQDSAWRNCKIIFSGHDQPGEGEHKIVDFVRRRKMQPDYDPNEKHVMYGLDADLIMLALATHEPNFILLREVVSFNQQTKKEKERAAEDEAKGIKEAAEYGRPDTFVLFHVKILREYLDKDIRRGNTYPNYNIERVLDDFVFMCFFIGNDFMPSIPTLAINDGSLSSMFDVYREEVLAKGTNLLRAGGKPNWNAVEDFLAKLSTFELDTLRARQDEEQEYQKRRAKIDPSHEVHINTTPIASIAEYKEKFYRDKHGFREGWQPRGPEMHELKQHYIEGIMWVLEYYFQGPPSWKWFYPHHYAPMASDLVNLTVHGTNVKFDRGEPFKPHQQLLAVLPPTSYRSMPKAYWPLLRSANSPLAKYFPKHLEIDREGARAPWEGTVLIPFLDEKVLLAAYESVQGDLTDEDRKRNEEGPAVLFEYDADCQPYLLHNAMFTSVPDVRVRRTNYVFPEMKTPFIPALCQGVRLGPEHIEGYGSLFAHDHESQPAFEVGAVSIFGRPSRKESLLIAFNEGEAVTVDDVTHVLGKEVWINFPHYKRGRVCCIVDRRRRISAQWDKDGNFVNSVSENLTAEEYRQFKKETETHQTFLKSKCGIVLPTIDVLVYVNRFVGMRISRKGRFLRQWSRRDTCYPLQLVSTPDQLDILEDARYQERDRQAGDFGQGQQVLYLGPDPKGHRGESVTGAIGYVLETQRTGQDDFSTLITRQFAKPQAVPKSLFDACASDNWLSLHDLTDRLRAHLNININGMAVSQICGSITTSAQWGSFELGLCLKFSGKNLARVGLAKLVTSNYNPWYVGNSNLFETMEQGEGNHYLDEAGNEKGHKGGKGGNKTSAPALNASAAAGADKGHWFFSGEAFQIIAEYCQKFLPLVQRIVAGGHNHLSFDMSQVLTGPWADKDADAVQKMIVEWLEAKGVHSIPMISATDDAFTKDVVRALEASLEATTPRPTQELKLRRVLGRHIHIPAARAADGSVVAVPLPARDQKYAIGNRVVYARTTGIVPFGATGTIVRLLGDGKSCDVVFDEPFVGGSHLGGRLQSTRGGQCKLAALLVTTAKPTAIYDPNVPEQAIVAATGKPYTAPVIESQQPQPQQQQQQPAAKQPKVADTAIPSPKSQQKVGQQAPAAKHDDPRKGVPKADAPAPAAAAPVSPATQAAQAAPKRWNEAPPRHTPVTVRNALMSKVTELLAQRKQQQ
mmetsp:Transcript_27521/g.85308  ORF Transcript_27521/g.85308 Transcript_27521/m.85308 type:complete len:1348 (-) Transcript_27521:488-4531(-)